MSPRIADAAQGLRHVFVHDLVLHAAIGVYPREHGQTQRVRINVDLAVADPGAMPGGTPVGADDLARVVDYRQCRPSWRRVMSGWLKPWRNGSPRLVSPTNAL